MRTIEKPEKTEKQAIGYSKHQLSVCKELIDRGMFSVATHFCMTCDSKNSEPDEAKLCIICAIDHKKRMPSHQMTMVANAQLIQAMFKKSQSLQGGMFVNCSNFAGADSSGSAFEQIVRERLYELIAATEDSACVELTSFVRELLLFK